MEHASQDYRQLDDPAFVAERARVRAALEHTSAATAEHDRLARVWEAMTAEYARRARIPATSDAAA